ncbi:MAG: TonB-dependent receptor plug domain-containing protein, partial [Pseudomonadota bacterium]
RFGARVPALDDLTEAHANGEEASRRDRLERSTGIDPEEVLVLGSRNEAVVQDLGKPVDILSGDELRMKLSSTLGETIGRELGVHNASFGPGVGLPVVRGMSGVRVRASEGGIGAWDASSLSPDHATTVEAVLADSIEIVRGASTLRYGSGAIGGVVNVETGRIHRRALEEPLLGSLETRYEPGNDRHQRTFAAKMDGSVGRFVLHVDGFARASGDVSIPGVAIDEAAVAEQFFFDASQDNTNGFIANTDAQAAGGAGGFSFVTDRGYIGIAVSQLDNDYGIPPGAHTEPADADHNHAGDGANDGIAQSPDVRIDLRQTRYDLKSGWTFEEGRLREIEFLVGHIDYEHVEAEEGFAGTRFQSEVNEARVAVSHRSILGFTGEIGVHAVERFFAATGAESFVPP